MKIKIASWFSTTKLIKRFKIALRKRRVRTLPKYPVPGTIWIILECIDTFEVLREQEMTSFRVRAQEIIQIGGLLKKKNKPVILQVWLDGNKKPEKGYIFISCVPKEGCSLLILLGATVLYSYGGKEY